MFFLLSHGKNNFVLYLKLWSGFFLVFFYYSDISLVIRKKRSRWESDHVFCASIMDAGVKHQASWAVAVATVVSHWPSTPGPGNQHQMKFLKSRPFRPGFWHPCFSVNVTLINEWKAMSSKNTFFLFYCIRKGGSCCHLCGQSVGLIILFLPAACAAADTCRRLSALCWRLTATEHISESMQWAEQFVNQPLKALHCIVSDMKSK